MLGGILPFLIQWLALSHLGSQLMRNEFSYSYPPKSQWTLLNEFATLSEDEIERFLPQVCNILVDRDTVNDYRLLDHLEKIVLDKCSICFPFGLKVCNFLRASTQGPSEGLFRNFLLSNSIQQDRQDRIRQLQERVEMTTSYGVGLDPVISQHRCEYFRDMTFMLDSLARLGTELKRYPPIDRNHHLRVAISQLNTLLYRRMLNKGQLHNHEHHMSFESQDYNNNQLYSNNQYNNIQQFNGGNNQYINPYVSSNSLTMQSNSIVSYNNVVNPSIYQILPLLPNAASYSLHFPFQKCQEKALKILRFVESDCEVLPSKDRVPYLLVVELLEEDYPCNSIDLYYHLKKSKDYIEKSSDVIENGNDEITSDSINIDGILESNNPVDYRGGSDNYNNQYSNYDAYQQQQPTIDAGSYSNYKSNNPYNEPTSYSNEFQPNYQSEYINNPSNYPNSIPTNYLDNTIPNQPRITFIRGQTWLERKNLLKSISPFGHLPNWTVKSFMIKSGDDLKKEVVAMQLIDYCINIFQKENIDLYLHPYQILVTGYEAGLVEFIEGTKSIDRIKKSASRNPSTLKDYFEYSFGPSYTLIHANAVENFARSLAGYSLVTYLLQVKDRHNANLLIDTEGHIIHIDYGFILGDSPGFNIGFENAPFKLTREYIDLLGGIESQAFKIFEDSFVRGFFALQKHIDGLIAIIQLFYGDRRKGCIEGLKSRLLYASNYNDVISLIRDSLDSWRTKQYDVYQQKSNNIYM